MGHPPSLGDGNTQSPEPLLCRAIGQIRSRFVLTTAMPIQSAAAQEETGQIEVFDEFVAGLRDITDFEYLFVLTHLHQAGSARLELTPFLDDKPHGIFATRAPLRPNPIGLSLIRLLAVEGNKLHFGGNDMIDGTPVLDIKPYVPTFDARSTERIGWYADRLAQLQTTLADDRMAADPQPKAI